MGPAYPYNKTVRIFRTLCKIIYLLCGKKFWFEDMKYPPIFMKIYNTISKVLDVIVLVSVITSWGSFYTQHNLTEKQNNDMVIFAVSNVAFYSGYANVLYYKRQIRELLQTLTVRLKQIYNDEMVERMMIKTTTCYAVLMYSLCSSFMVISFGIQCGFRALTSNATFTTVIPVWPDVEDRRLIAAIARVLHYIVWWFFAIRISSSYVVVLTTTIGIGYQFRNLCKYFEGLNSIFEEESTQREKEKRYEDAFKVGIEMHSTTLWCTEQILLVGGLVFSEQMVVNVTGLVLFMIQIMDADRTLMGVMPLVYMVGGILLGTGVFLWTAGNVTFEASHLPAAMFHSGWHNCQKESSVRVRKMVTIAITEAQKQVVLKGLYVIELSYENYVTICKSTYSLFSVIY